MDLRDCLEEVFPKRKEERYVAMISELNAMGIYAMSDLEFVKEETLKSIQSFTPVEHDKLISNIKNPENLMFALKSELYYGTSESRLEEIKRVLNDKEIYSRKDILSFNTNEVRREGSLSRAEIKKLEEFIKNNNKDHYEEIMKEKTFIESDLRPVLMEIFRGCSEERVSQIEDILKKQDVTSKKDLLVIDTNRLRLTQELSDSELMKIERYLEINNKEHYVAMKTKEFGIISILKELFEASSYERNLVIENFFIKQAITSKRDLLHVNTNALMKKGVLWESEMKKIENYLKENNREQYDDIIEERNLEKFNPEKLDDVLNKIFSGTPDDRINEIKEILRENEVYSGTHVLLVNTIKLTNERSLSEAEILKIKQYIRENYSERFDDIVEKQRFEREKEVLQFEMAAKGKEIHDQMAMEQKQVYLSMIKERHITLVNEMKTLVDKLSTMCDNKPDLKKGVETYFGGFRILLPFGFIAGEMLKIENPTQEHYFEKLPMALKEIIARIEKIIQELKEVEEELKEVSDEAGESKT